MIITNFIVDDLAKMIISITLQQDIIGKNYHVRNQRLVNYNDIANAVLACGFPMKELDYNDWRMILTNSTSNALSELIPYFPANENNFMNAIATSTTNASQILKICGLDNYLNYEISKDLLSIYVKSLQQRNLIN